jgi:hypothetical protein
MQIFATDAEGILQGLIGTGSVPSSDSVKALTRSLDMKASSITSCAKE